MHSDRQFFWNSSLGFKPRSVYFSVKPDACMANIYVYNAIALTASVLCENASGEL